VLNCFGRNVVRVIKKMEGQDNLVGPQLPSTHDQLFASLPITRKFNFSDGRIGADSLVARSSQAQTYGFISRSCATCRHAARSNQFDYENVALVQARRGDLDRKRLDTRGGEVSRVSDE
jgi:hypothetical protein